MINRGDGTGCAEFANGNSYKLFGGKRILKIGQYLTELWIGQFFFKKMILIAFRKILKKIANLATNFSWHMSHLSGFCFENIDWCPFQANFYHKYHNCLLYLDFNEVSSYKNHIQMFFLFMKEIWQIQIKTNV